MSGVLTCAVGALPAVAAPTEPAVATGAADTPRNTWATHGASRTSEGSPAAQVGAPDADGPGANPWLLGIGGAMALIFVVTRRRSDDRA